MVRKTELINVIDIEATCWDTEREKHANTSEIIEVGLAVVDVTHSRIIENTGWLIMPLESRVSPFCTKLTTITENMLRGQDHFENVLANLAKDFDSRNRAWASWGDYDRNMFWNQCQRRNHKYPFGPRHMNLKTLFSVLRGFEGEMGLGRALNQCGMTFEGTPHRGLSDAHNIGRILLDLMDSARKI